VELYTAPGDIVLDPFAGTGSTCVAAGLSGRGFIGIESDQACYFAAVSRLEKALGFNEH